MEVVVAFALATFVGLFALWRSARAAVTVCVLDVTGGRVSVREGALSPRVRSDVEEIVRRPRVKSATIRLVRDREFAKLEVTGAVSADQIQQLRNVIGNTPIAKLIGGRRAAGKA
jgi:hypothetical protein